METFVVEFSLTTKEGLTIVLHANVLPQITGPRGASMNLRQWTSNCDEFLDSLPEGEKLSGKSIKVFGIIWN